jgi:hypothetical protein
MKVDTREVRASHQSLAIPWFGPEPKFELELFGSKPKINHEPRTGLLAWFLFYHEHWTGLVGVPVRSFK